MTTTNNFTTTKCCHYGCNRPFTPVNRHDKDTHEATCHHRIIGCGSACRRPLKDWLGSADGSKGPTLLLRCCEHNSSILISAIKNDDRILLTYLVEMINPSSLLENLGAETSSGDTALTLAARCGRHCMLASLLQYLSHHNCNSAMIHNETTRGATALIEATRQNHQDCVRLLLGHHADPNRVSKVHARSAIDWASDFAGDDILKELEKQGRVIKGFRLLCLTIARGDGDTLEKMVGVGEPYHVVGTVGYVSHLEACISDTERMLTDHERDMTELPAAITSQKQEIEHARGRLESASVEVSKQTKVVDTVAQQEDDLKQQSDRAFRSAITSLQASMIPTNVAELSSLTRPTLCFMTIAKVVVLLISAGCERGGEATANTTAIDKAPANLDEYWEKLINAMDEPEAFFHRLRHYDANYRLTPESAKCIDDMISSGAIDTTGTFLLDSLAAWAKAVHICRSNHVQREKASNHLVKERHRLDHFIALRDSRRNELAVSERKRSMLEQEQEEANKRFAMSIQKLRTLKEKLHVHRLMSHVTESGHSLLSWASAYGNKDIVQILISHGANLGLGDEYLSLAARLIQESYRYYHWKKKKTDVTSSSGKRHQRQLAHRLLVKSHGRLLLDRRRHVRSPLAEAYLQGHAGVALLLEREAPLFHLMLANPRKPCGIIPFVASPMDNSSTLQDISECIVQGQLRCESSELEEGDIDTECDDTDEGNSICLNHLSVMKKRIALEVEQLRAERLRARRVRKYRARLSEAQNEMNQAIRDSNYHMMISAVDTGESGDVDAGAWLTLDWETPDGITPLIRAVMDADSQASAVSFLLDRKVAAPSIDYETKMGGDTALIVAARCSRLAALELLLDRGAELNRQSSMNGQTALIVAGKEGRPRVVQMLLERGANASIKDGEDKTARDYALESNHVDAVAILEAFSQRDFVGLARAAYGTSYNRVLCQFGCGAMEDLGEKLDDHHRKCPLRPCRCLLCGVLVEARELSNHDENDCSERPVTCALCHDRIPRSFMNEHRAKECCKREVECPKCLSHLKADILHKHQSFICQHRLIACPLECGAEVEFCDLQRHRRHECPRRTVRCKRCNDLVPMDELKDHVDKEGGSCTIGYQ